MALHLLPCPGCARHVRADESRCPFCLAPLALASEPAPRTPLGRLGRSATFAFGAAVAATMNVAGCGDGSTPAGDAGGRDDGGAEMRDAQTESDSGSVESDSGSLDDGGGPAPLYGAPPPDGGGTGPGVRDAGDDGGGPATLYGAPPPADDAGTMRPDAGGGPAPLYGAPPPRE